MLVEVTGVTELIGMKNIWDGKKIRLIQKIQFAREETEIHLLILSLYFYCGFLYPIRK